MTRPGPTSRKTRVRRRTQDFLDGESEWVRLSREPENSAVTEPGRPAVLGRGPVTAIVEVARIRWFWVFPFAKQPSAREAPHFGHTSFHALPPLSVRQRRFPNSIPLPCLKFRLLLKESPLTQCQLTPKGTHRGIRETVRYSKTRR